MISNLKTKRAYDGFFKMDTLSFDQKRFDGRTMDGVVREVFVRKPVVFLSLYDPKNDKILMIEQVRVGAISHDIKNPTVIEPIAGIIDEYDENNPEYSALQAAVREAEEEAGIDVDIDSIQVIQGGYTSPGGSSEFAYYATGLFDSSNYKEQVKGLETEQEDIRSILLSIDDAMEKVFNGEVNSLSAAFGIYWHKAHS